MHRRRDGGEDADRRSSHLQQVAQPVAEQVDRQQVLTIDEGDVVTRAEEIGRRVWRQLVARYPNVPFPIRLPPPVSGAAD